MKRLFFALIALVFAVGMADAQTIKPLSKRETKEFITKIQHLMSVGKYEAAINDYQSEASRIVPKNIAKSDRAWWENLVTELEHKTNLFNRNDSIMAVSTKLYAAQKYWDCNESLKNLNLNSDCAKAKTIKEYNSLSDNMKSHQSTLEAVNNKMPEIVEIYSKKDIEQLFLTFFRGVKLDAENSGGDIKNYVDREYLSTVTAIIDEFSSQFEKYNNAYSRIYTKSVKKINSLPSIKNMGHNEAKQSLNFFKSLEASIKQENRFYNANYPHFSKQLDQLLAVTLKAIPALYRRIQDTNPINTYLSSNIVNIQQIKTDYAKIDEDLTNILALDVVSYFDKKFSSELQAELYKETTEYKTNYDTLKKLKSQVLNTVYYSSIQVNTGEYSLEKGCFFLKIGTNKGTMPYLPGMQPKVSHSNEIDGVVHESLTISSFINKWISAGYINGDKFYTYCIALQVPKSKAVELENIDCELVISFVPAGLKTYRCMGADYDGRSGYDIFYANKTAPFSSKCRLLLFDKSGNLLVDKIL